MVRKLAAAVVVVLIAAYLLLALVPVQPVAWHPPTDAGYSGPYARNTRLAHLRRIPLGGEVGPEHVAIGPDGMLYTGVDGGKVLRMNPDGSSRQVWAQTGGRVLGIDFDAQGRLIAADAVRGLLAIVSRGDPNHTEVTVLAGNDRDDPIRFANAVAVAKDGKIYFTDSSRRFLPSEWGGTWNASVVEILEHSATGRVLVYDPRTSTIEVLASGLSFANGIALSGDQDSIVVAETGEYRIWRFAVSVRNLNVRGIERIAGPTVQMLLSNLPGFPDNVTRGMNGRYWVGLSEPRNRAVDAMAGHPLVRKAAYPLRSFLPVSRPYAHVFAFDERGNVVADLQDPTGTSVSTAGVTETADRLYIQSVRATDLGWLPKAEAGLR